MPAPQKITREQIVAAALTLVRRKGEAALNARALAAALGCSTQPIFSNFESMEQLRLAVLDAANAQYLACLHRELTQEDAPPYMRSGLGYLRFAQEDGNLFKLLFLRDRHGAPLQPTDELDEVLALLQRSSGLSRAQAERFHLHMWLFVHGIAVALLSSYTAWTREELKQLLSDAYTGQLLLCRSQTQSNQEGIE